MDTAVAVVGDSVEEVLAQVEIADSAADAAVDDGGDVGGSVNTDQVELLTAKRVGVWIAGAVGVEEGVGDGDNGVAWSVGPSAGTETVLVPGKVTLVRSARGVRGTAVGGRRGGSGSAGGGSGCCSRGGWSDVNGGRRGSWRDVDGGRRSGWRNIDRGGRSGWRNVDRARRARAG